MSTPGDVRNNMAPEYPLLEVVNEGGILVIKPVNFKMRDDLAEKLMEKLAANISLRECKDCGHPFIKNSNTHVICWRCK